MRRIAVIDAETDPFKAGRIPRPFVWGYYDGDTYREFWRDGEAGSETDAAVGFLEDQKVICYAHNGGRFDWHFLLQYLEPYSDVMLIEGRIAKMKIGQCECRDSYNIIPVPLAAYKKDEIDYAIMEPGVRERPANRAKISKYLKSDCVYLYELVSRFISEYGLKLTQAGAAMAQWAKMSDQDLPHTDADFYEQHSKYYFGGRVQCFRAGIINTRFKVYDINSAYPFAMLHKHPYSKDFDHAEGYRKGADFYTLTCESRGALAYRDEGGGLDFPCDGETRTFHTTKWEIEAARETGALVGARFLESVRFRDHVDFAPYVNHFYNVRLAAKACGDEAGSLFAKLLMNSLYGKFAANPERYRESFIVPMDVIHGLAPLGYDFAGEFGPWGLAQCELSEDQQRYYNVATGASITGFVRAMLWRAIAGSKGVLYCDTDSVAVTRRGASILLGNELGRWKDEGTFDRAGIGGKKLYVFRGVKDANGERDYKYASKGARLTINQLWKIARGGEVEYSPDVPTFSTKKAAFFQTRRIQQTI